MYVTVASEENENSLKKLHRQLSALSYQVNTVALSELSNDVSSVHQHRILYVSAGKLSLVTELVTTKGLLFDLLICNSERVLKQTALLSRCASILITPVESEVLADAMADLFLPQVASPELLALSMNYVGSSVVVKQLMQVIERVAKYDAPVLIHGETGTGKELVARGVHYESSRCDFPFVPVNCGALTDDLLLSELFGYEQGAFTDAKKQRAGLVAQASQGTLFLDEIDSLSGKAQTALLRFLQDQEYRPLGSEKVLRSNVRVICATNRNLKTRVASGKFREDLYYRLQILDVKTPSLRHRPEDIAELIDYFMDKLSKKYAEPAKRLHPLTEQWMVNGYDWPGNVRELENYLHRIFVLARSKTIYVPEVMGAPLSVMTGGEQPVKDTDKTEQLGRFKDEKALHVNRFERGYLIELMRKTSGNISKAARISGKERRALGRLLKKHGIESTQFKVNRLTDSAALRQQS